MKVEARRIFKRVERYIGIVAFALSIGAWLSLQFGFHPPAFEIPLIITLLAFIYQKIVSADNSNQNLSQPEILGQVDVVTRLYEIIGETKSSHRKLQVIGMNMEMSWSLIKTKLSEESFHGWNFQFATYIGDSSTKDNTKDWRDNSIKNLKSMLVNRERDEVQSRKISIDIYAYSFPPAVHGFRFGNNDIMISTLHRLDDGQLSLSNYCYEFISHKDHSPYANEKRALFDSWWRAATSDRDTVRKLSEGEL